MSMENNLGLHFQLLALQSFDKTTMNPYFSNYSWCPNPNPYFVPFQSYYKQRAFDQAPKMPNPTYNWHYWQTRKNLMAIRPYQQRGPGHHYVYCSTFFQKTSVKNESSKPSSEPSHNSQEPRKWYSYVCYPDQADQEQQLQSSSQVDWCKVQANWRNEYYYSLFSDPDIKTSLDGDLTMSDVSDTSLVVHEDKRRANTDDIRTVNGNLSPCKEKQEDEVSDVEFLAMCKKNMDELLNIEKNFIAVKDKFDSLMDFEEDCINDSL